MISAERIRLRAIEREDIPRFVEWLNDPQVTVGLTMHLPLALADETRWFESLSARPLEERPLAIEVKTPAGGWQHIGNVGLQEMEWMNRCASFGIFIGEKSFWN